MAFVIPRPKITKEQCDKFLKDPEVVTLEVLFVGLTLCNVFVLYRILLNVCPFPVVVTWFQLLVGLIFAFVLGEASREFPRCAFFPPFSIDIKLYEGLAVPTLIYFGMIVMANVLLRVSPSIAAFPVVVSLAVVFHHISRFFGCGQIYQPIRWISLAVMFFGFFVAIFDKKTMGMGVFPLAVLYALCSAIFRAWCLEKAMHVVEGRGNTLHNHQVVMGLLLLPFLAVLFGEWKVFQWMPNNFGKLFTWQAWGCLISAGTIPFLKNVVANRMIRRTGQAPWRILEAISMLLVFLIGFGVYDMVTVCGSFAFFFVLSGRVLGLLDALSKDPDERRRAIRQEASHQTTPPSEPESAAYDPTGVSDSFDRPAPTSTQRSIQSQASRASGQKSQSLRQDDIEMAEEPQQLQEEPLHTAPLLLTAVEDEECEA